MLLVPSLSSGQRSTIAISQNAFAMKKNFRKLAVDELAHRLKNKIATIRSIVNFRLREDPEIRNDINSALSSLMAVDDLITSTQGKGADIGEILSAELGPYDVSRVAMDGPRCLLAPKLALIMALLIHELATNAAKYGALSTAEGKLSVKWSLSDDRLQLAWAESGGPHVNAPDHSGFGTRLFRERLNSSTDASMRHLRRQVSLASSKSFYQSTSEHASGAIKNVSPKGAEA